MDFNEFDKLVDEAARVEVEKGVPRERVKAMIVRVPVSFAVYRPCPEDAMKQAAIQKVREEAAAAKYPDATEPDEPNDEGEGEEEEAVEDDPEDE